MKLRPNKEGILLGLGLLLASIGSLLLLFWPNILDLLVHKNMILVNDPSNKIYQSWTKSPIPLIISFNFFNWTNPEDINIPDMKPIFTEVGPVRFRETVEKVNVTWNENGTVTYQKIRKWYFLPELSNVTLDQKITTLNAVPLTATSLTKTWPMWKRIPLSMALGSQNIYITKRIGELLFEGYSDPLITMARTMPGSLEVPFDRFGWFYKRNGSYHHDGVFNMETGVNGPSTIGKLRNWNYKQSTPYFGGQCASVRGSAGEFWPGKKTKEDVIELFSPDLCRYIDFFYSEEAEIVGIPGYKYRAGIETLDNGTLDSRNKCFCGGECVPSGALNVSSCRLGAPAFVSYPHFYLADESYRDAVIGMNPDKEKHDVYITVEPFTSIPLEVAARFQINLLLQPDSTIGLFKKVPRIFFPMLWFEQHVVMTQEIANEISLVLKAPMAGSLMALSIFLTGVLIVAVVLIRMRTQKRVLEITPDLKTFTTKKPKVEEKQYKETEIPLVTDKVIANLDVKMAPKIENQT